MKTRLITITGIALAALALTTSGYAAVLWLSPTGITTSQQANSVVSFTYPDKSEISPYYTVTFNEAPGGGSQTCPTPVGGMVTCALTGLATDSVTRLPVEPHITITYTSALDAIFAMKGNGSFIEPVNKQDECNDATCIRNLTMFLPGMATDALVGDVKAPLKPNGNKNPDVTVDVRVVNLDTHNIRLFTVPASLGWATAPSDNYFKIVGVGANEISGVTVDVPDGGFKTFRNGQISSAFATCEECGSGNTFIESSMVLLRSGGGKFDYALSVPSGQVVSFVPGDTISLTGLDDVTGATVSGDLGCFTSSFTSLSVTLTDARPCFFSSSTFGTLEVSSLQRLGTVDWAIQSDSGNSSGNVGGPVPEPSSLLMLASGVFGLAGVLRKKLAK